MKNLTTLSNQELQKVNGGNNYYDDGNGGCIRTSGPKPIIVIKPTTGPTFPGPETQF
ncbi:bacteriocin [Aquimarina gracilis]|uniref:Bacteriocin n=1 Tax=Aquimarina gracilis TaxID=874422 RepID=A0ABU6A060_9FLAO|nr:bacteriocin [Aquimarina gracilis]MEB3347547.1 bacteriocin [Aquimarina gracilis]